MPVEPATSARNKVLVFGASGYIGSNLVPYLVDRGYDVRAVARNQRVIEGRGWRRVECRSADALDPASLPAVLADVEVAYYLVHSMAAGAEFGRLDLDAATNFRDAAAAAGVRRIVYLGGLIPENPESEHLQSRLETGDVLRAGPVPVTEIRAGMIVGPGSAAFEVMRDLVNYLPVMVTPRWVESRSPPIALADLLYYLLEVAFIDEAAGRTLDAAGPDTLTYREVMNMLARILGKRRLIIKVPLLTPRLSSYWLRLVTAVPVNVARALIDGLRHDVLADDRPLRALAPRELIPLEQAIRDALRAEREQDLPAHWVEGSIRCRNFEPRYAYYAKRASGYCLTSASPDAVWAALCEFGRENDFFALNGLWWLRRAGDWLLGGPSFRRRRRDPVHLRYGDVIDSWRVIGLDPAHKLTLLMEMRAPGAGVLEFEITPEASGHRLTATAYFHPAGVWGLLYWFPLIPAHLVIFRRMTRTVCQRAETRQITE
ncbi:MAG: DUF2867 domain-containing protein [Halieaceae bacterium]|nr:DUF2867 domain-containing protein [Halieaceae bacterium]